MSARVFVLHYRGQWYTGRHFGEWSPNEAYAKLFATRRAALAVSARLRKRGYLADIRALGGE